MNAQREGMIESDVIDKCAASGAQTIPRTRLTYQDFEECEQCGHLVRWDQTDDSLFGFAAQCKLRRES
jgi:hypothetical protein